MASKNIGLSVALAVYNEEKNLERCLSSVGDIADEIVVVDGGSTDGTAHIAKAAGATVIQAVNPEIFHVNKQKAIANCHREWILQLDADEQVSVALAQEIRRVLNMSDVQRSTRQIDSRKKILFERHQKIVEDRDGKIGGNTGIITAYFIPRLNYFLGQPIRHAGTYPDGVIRLVKNGFAHFPAKSVHEQIEIKGRVSWLENDLWHFSNPTLKKYLTGARKYINLQTKQLQADHVTKSIVVCLKYLVLYPISTFLTLYIRNKGILDGWRGFLFCLFSAGHYPLTFIQYVGSHKV